MKKIIFSIRLIILSSKLVYNQSYEFTLVYTGFDGMMIPSITEDTSGNIWAANWISFDSSAIVLIDDESITVTVFIYTRFPIWGMDVDQQNNLWIAT